MMLLSSKAGGVGLTLTGGSRLILLEVRHTSYGISHTVYIIPYMTYGIQHTVYDIRYTAHGIHHTAYSIRFTSYGIRHTLLYAVRRQC